MTDTRKRLGLSLTPAQMARITAARGDGIPWKDIGANFGVSPSHIKDLYLAQARADLGKQEGEL